MVREGELPSAEAGQALRIASRGDASGQKPTTAVAVAVATPPPDAVATRTERDVVVDSTNSIVWPGWAGAPLANSGDGDCTSLGTLTVSTGAAMASAGTALSVGGATSFTSGVASLGSGGGSTWPASSVEMSPIGGGTCSSGRASLT
eukprot:scaffold57768_cov25-Tisochrysis_lutea.AAC.5